LTTSRVNVNVVNVFVTKSDTNDRKMASKTIEVPYTVSKFMNFDPQTTAVPSILFVFYSAPNNGLFIFRRTVKPKITEYE